MFQEYHGRVSAPVVAALIALFAAPASALAAGSAPDAGRLRTAIINFIAHVFKRTGHRSAGRSGLIENVPCPGMQPVALGPRDSVQ